MKHIARLILLTLFLLLTGHASAQVEVRLDPIRHDFILGETVGLKVTLTNHTDRAIKLANIPGRGWLNFTVTRNGENTPISPAAVPRYPGITLTPGSRRSYQLELQPYFKLTREGSYKVIATVRMPDMQTTYSSNRASFNLGSGGTIRNFTIQARGQRLKMGVKIMNVGGRDCLFGQVLNADTNLPIGACFLGQFLNFMEPRILLDRAQNLHVLCQSTPEYFTYAIMNTRGGRSQHKIFRRTGGPVDLISTGNGIRTLGLTPYVKPSQNPERIHSASDRPH